MVMGRFPLRQLAFAPWYVGTFSGGQFHQHLDDGVRHVSHWSPWDLHVAEKKVRHMGE